MSGSRPGTRALAGAILVTVLTSMPVFLVGALANQISADTHAPSWAIGLAVGVYWAGAAVASVLAGTLNTMVGERGLGVVAVTLAIVSLAGSALVAATWVWLLVWAIVGGLSNGFGHPSSNYAIASTVRPVRRGVAFGTKQAAVPIAGLVAGISIPLISLTLGWQWAFGLAAVAGLGVLVVALGRTSQSGNAPTRLRERLSPHLRNVFIVMAVTTALAAGAANSAVAFAVTGAQSQGIDDGTAGILLASGSLIGAVLRVVFGALVDRGRVQPMPLVTAITVVCAIGLALMSMANPVTFTVGFLLAGGVGWSWPGLVHLSVARLAPVATVSATGFVQSGSYTGSALGPIITGVLIGINPASAWIVLSVVAVGAALMSLVVRVMTRGPSA